MKTTIHPHLLAAFGISAGIFALHSRGFADVPFSANHGLRLQIPMVVELAPIGTVVPKHDPFVANVDEVISSTIPQQSAVDGMIGTVDNGRPQQEQKVDAQAGLHLRAVVLGTHRYALVADGSSSQIVTVGSKLAGSVVSDISLQGIALANGARFLPEEAAK